MNYSIDLISSFTLTAIFTIADLVEKVIELFKS